MEKTSTRKGSRKQFLPGEIELDLPPFPGFDKTGFTFLKELKKNNDRAWFTERKDIYEAHLLEPMRLLLGELRGRFREEGLTFNPDPKRGIFRIYRDIRFSKDKTPYKTHLGATVPYADEGKEGVGNYIHIEPGGCFYGGGAYVVEPAGLRRLRLAVARDTARFRDILEQLQSQVGPLHGARLKRPPAGFDRDHPALDLLLYTQMWASASFSDTLAMSRELVDWIVNKTRATADFTAFLYEAIQGAGPSTV